MTDTDVRNEILAIAAKKLLHFLRQPEMPDAKAIEIISESICLIHECLQMDERRQSIGTVSKPEGYGQ